MKKIVAVVFSVLCSLASAYETYPYSALQEILPFHPHSQYQNAEMMGYLIRNLHVKVVVEVGSWMGASTIDIAEKIPEDGIVYAVDHWLGTPGEHQVYNRDVLPKLYDHFLSNVIHKNLTQKIIPVRMPSLEAAKWLKTFRIRPDLIYIDAGHDEESVYADLKAWFPLVQGHGVICGDDWVIPGVERAVNRFASENGFSVGHFGIGWVLLTD